MREANWLNAGAGQYNLTALIRQNKGGEKMAEELDEEEEALAEEMEAGSQRLSLTKL